MRVIRHLYLPLVRIRALIVMALMALTLGASLSATEAQAVNISHMALGEVLLPDGGWTSACEPGVELCTAHSDANGDHDMPGLQHHHHADYPFNALAVVVNDIAPPFDGLIRFGAGAAPAFKPGSLSAADQPPRA